jgi:hypothetical protein
MWFVLRISIFWLNSSFISYIVFLVLLSHLFAFIFILLEFNQMFIHVPFNFIDHYYNHSFEFFVWDFFHFTIISVSYCGVADFWSSCIVLFFHSFYVSALRFSYLRPSHWLKVLITCRLSADIFLILRQDNVVVGLRCYFPPLDWLRNSSIAKHMSSCSGH